MGLKIFIQDRKAALVNKLAAWNCFAGVQGHAGAPDFGMFPNPAHESVRISSPEEITRLALYDISGREVLEHEGRGLSGLALNLRGSDDGVYFLELNGSAIKKLVINR